MESAATPFEALKAAVARAGSQVAFARICTVSQPAVWKWLQSSKRLPAEHVLTVERETGVSKHLLRPDLYPAEMPEISPAGCHTSVATGAPIVACDRGAALKVAANG